MKKGLIKVIFNEYITSSLQIVLKIDLFVAFIENIEQIPMTIFLLPSS